MAYQEIKGDKGQHSATLAPRYIPPYLCHKQCILTQMLPELLHPNPEACVWTTSLATEMPGRTSVLPRNQLAVDPQLLSAQLAASYT